MIGRHPEFDTAVIAAGCSGHGFKMSSTLGERLADLAEGKQPVDIGIFSPGRFLKTANG